ncbi:hypothetical protein AB0J86_35820 [Micromonospora sp. NPDC049559]|uniref:hypothetical protein n=1 Tax=Micromonospora sp. NPDC049559 TaxID=3155923 RepID=UPI003422AAC7
MSPSHTRGRIRAGALALAAAAVLFLLYPAVRPWTDETTTAGATAAMSSGAWVASHLFAMIGFVLLPLGLLALRAAVGQTRAEPLALAATVTAWLGAGLTLPYYGAEDFGLHAVASRTAGGAPLDLLDLVDAIRFGAVQVTTFGIGLVALGIAAVLAAVAIWRSGILPRHSGIAFALGFALFLPQFYLPPAARITHGVLVGIGCAWVALTLWRGDRTGRP